MLSKFMVGTEQGGVVVARMQAKAGTNDWILADFENCHQVGIGVVLHDVRLFWELIKGEYVSPPQGKVMAVDRNPFYPKNFLTVSFSDAKSDVLGEFHLSRLETRLAKSGARTWGAVPSCGWSLPRCANIYLDYDDDDYSGLKWWFWWLFWSKARLTDGCWSPTKISLFFTTRTDGFVEVGGNMKYWVEWKSNNITEGGIFFAQIFFQIWDFLHNQRLPILTIKVHGKWYWQSPCD